MIFILEIIFWGEKSSLTRKEVTNVDIVAEAQLNDETCILDLAVGKKVKLETFSGRELTDLGD